MVNWIYRDTRIGKRLGLGVGYFGSGLDIRFRNIIYAGCSFVYRNGYILSLVLLEGISIASRDECSSKWVMCRAISEHITPTFI